MTRRNTKTIVTLAILLVSGAASAASVDGVDLHWTSTGNGTQAVIFVHGWTCDETSWAAQVPAISRRYRVITLDLPGHGRSGSSATAELSTELFARAVEAVRRDAGVERPVLVGHSMGVPVIREYALMYPQHVSALVLVDGAVLVPGQELAFAPPPMTGEAGLAARENMIRGMFTPATPVPLQEQILKMMMSAPEATATGAMAAILDSSRWRSDPVTIPVLGIYASPSGPGGDNLERVFPKLERHEISGAGHFLMMEKPEEFNRLLGAFLTKIQ